MNPDLTTRSERIALGILGALCIPGFLVVACGAPAQGPAVAASECVAHRTASQLDCVSQYGAAAEIDACRARVQAAIDCTRDAGGQ